jgi:hypothetical protein
MNWTFNQSGVAITDVSIFLIDLHFSVTKINFKEVSFFANNLSHSHLTALISDPNPSLESIFKKNA